MKSVILVLVVLCAIAHAQNIGKYRPNSTRQPGFPTSFPGFPRNRVNTQVSDGRYQSGNDGRYRPENFGKYRGDGNAGKYVHVDNPYKHLDVAGGDYSGDANPYKHIGGAGGNYQGSNDRYKGDQYKGDLSGAGQIKPVVPVKPAGSASGSAFGKNSGFGSGSGAAFGSGTASSFGRGSGAPIQVNSDFADATGKSTLGVPQGLKYGDASGLYDNRNYGIIKKIEKVDEDGYHYVYETENKILAEEQGRIENRGSEAEGMRAKGFFLYTGPDNVEYKVTYTADERGFLPDAAHIPTPPPIPPLIAKMLAYKRSIGEI